jgi:uncharacterized protein YybS (DUF2232 family)
VPKEILRGIAITGLVFAISVFLPIGFITAFLMPLPIIFYRLKLGRKNAAIIPVAALAVILPVLGGISFDLLFFSELLLLGFLLGEFTERGFSIEGAIGWAAAGVLITGTAGLAFYGSASGTGFFDLVSGYVAKNLEVTMGLYENIGMPKDKIRIIAESMDEIQRYLVRILPALAASLALFVAWVNLLITRSLLARRGIGLPSFGILNHWKAPDPLVWGVIGCGAALLIPSGGIKAVGFNGLLVLLTVYFFHGMAVVSFFFEKKNFPVVLRSFLYGIIFLQQFFMLVVIGMGFFDTWMDFRRLGAGKDRHE